MNDTIPEHLPIDGADPKPWYASTAIWSGLASIGSGIGGIIAYLVSDDHPPEMLTVSVGAIVSGVGAIRGRVRAIQPIEHFS